MTGSRDVLHLVVNRAQPLNPTRYALTHASMPIVDHCVRIYVLRRNFIYTATGLKPVSLRS
jgi:hypothetical protein